MTRRKSKDVGSKESEPCAEEIPVVADEDITDTPNTNDVMLPRSVSRYVPTMR